MPLRRIIGSLITTLAATGAVAALAAPAAVAAPGAAAVTCQFTRSSFTGSVRCTGTSQQYRVVVGCYDSLHGSFVGYFDGPYVNPGQTSSRTCPVEGGARTYVQSTGTQFR